LSDENSGIRERENLSTSNNPPKNVSLSGLKRKFLSLEQIKQIDEVLTQLGDYGEVHLIIQHGELRYINKVESYKAWKTGDDS
jgi:hypothetical protein